MKLDLTIDEIITLARQSHSFAAKAVEEMAPIVERTQNGSRGSVPLDSEAMRYMAVGFVKLYTGYNKVPTIKFIREMSGCGLKEAKDYYEILEAKGVFS